MHLALGGCLGVPPVRFGLTADTGGHIAYVLGAATAQAALRQVRKVSIVTRLFEDDRLGAEFSRPVEHMGGKITIDRIATGNRAYLEKTALALDAPAFSQAFCRHLAALPALPDVIHAHFADAASIAQAARARYGIPFAYTPHALGLDKRDLVTGGNALELRIAAEREAIAQADAIIVSTRNEAERQVAAYGIADFRARTWRLPPGAPHPAGSAVTPAATGVLQAALQDPGKPIVLAIARPVRKKNLTGLMRAFLVTRALMDQANLVILAGQHGGGMPAEEERQVVAELKALADHPSLRGRVALPPEHDAADVAALYQRASAGGVFANPALHEPFGLTLIEAAAAGVPVVATREGGAADIIATTRHGFLVDPRSDAEIGAACLRIVADPVLHARLARAGRDNVHMYSWPRYAEGAVSLYAWLGRKPGVGKAAA